MRLAKKHVRVMTVSLPMLVLVAPALPGCARPLLSPTEERSPFDRYDALRAQYAPQYVEDEFGRQTPNVRARLAPRD